jgi:hypothetical protein
MHEIARALAGVLAAALILSAQSTQGVIFGRVTDLREGIPVAGAAVSYERSESRASGSVPTDAAGMYTLSSLTPGAYRLRVSANGYQPRELHDLRLPVAGFLELDFRLRPLEDVWEQGQYRSVVLPGTRSVVTFYGPDLDTSRSQELERVRGELGNLEATVSQVIDSDVLSRLPLAGRDVYTFLVTQPGVTADTTTARGLGLSAGGQRPSASGFLMDGIENNNYLVTGPGVTVSPEMVEEYRISTNNFSAEYGRTSGYLANAITRAGGARWHASGYTYIKNEALNANGFQENLTGFRRNKLRESYRGLALSGPVAPQRVFASGNLEYLRNAGRQDPVRLLLPTTRFGDFTAPRSVARRLLEQYPAPPVTVRNLPVAELEFAPPVTLNRYLATLRADAPLAGGRHRLLARTSIARLERPDFIWTPYKDFSTPLRQNSTGAMLSVLSSLTGNLTHELRAGWNSDDLRFDRPHPEIPSLAVSDGLVLPGSPAFYSYRNHGHTLEFVDNVQSVRGRHILKSGATVLLRSLDGYLTAGRDGLFLFPTYFEFILDQPSLFGIAVSRQELPELAMPRYDRRYSNRQFAAFLQDSFRVSSRLFLNAGVRYEYFGAPRNTGVEKDTLVELGSGGSLAERLVRSRLKPGGDQLYDADANNFALRFGFSFRPLQDRRTLLRGSYGIFYDRPFDNLWQNIRSNSFVLALFSPGSRAIDYLAPRADVLAAQRGKSFPQDFPNLTAYQPGLRDAYAQSYFVGLQRQVSDALFIEVNGTGTLGRKLITTDLINRPGALSPWNPALPYVSYRGNQGTSTYHGLTVAARYRNGPRQFHAAYTWSHTLDNQSEPLAGDFFNLDFTRNTPGVGRPVQAAFSRQFDSRADRGNSDFDQRHNLVFFSMWDLPGPLRQWKVAQIAALRSGFPYTVFASQAGPEVILNNRADLIGRATVDGPAQGGRQLLDAASFSPPAPGALGNTGRNAFRGPGLFNIDLSVSRTFRLPFAGERLSVTFRADAFNLLNHANLNNPDPFLDSETFGLALYGRRGRRSGFPALTPFDETARQIQLLLRIEF